MDAVFLGEAYRPQTEVQRLNNLGAQLIEAMSYDRAITVLEKAIVMTKKLAKDSGSFESFGCPLCTFDDLCMSSIGVGLQAQCIQSCAQIGTRSRNAKEVQDTEASFCGYLYRKPVYVASECLQSDHKVGVTFSSIVIFNLALAHQLSVLRHPEQQAQKIRKAIRLYEVAYELHVEQQRRYQEDTTEEEEEATENQYKKVLLTSLRFIMIIANNMGECYRLQEDSLKHNMCLENLLSLMMYIVDCRLPTECIEMDGFLRNTSHLILQKQCASAA